MSENREELKAIRALRAVDNELKLLELLHVYLQECPSVPMTSDVMKTALLSLDTEKKKMKDIKEHNEKKLECIEENWRWEVEQNYSESMGW